MKIIDKIYHAKQAPRNKNVLWIDGEKKMYVYGNKWENLGNSGNSGGVTPEEVIKASQVYPYNIDFDSPSIQNQIFEGDLMINYVTGQATDMRLFAEGSFLANHVKKINIMGYEVEDFAFLSDIITWVKNTYDVMVIPVKFTLDTDTIEGDLFGINYETDPRAFLIPISILVNCKVKSLDCSHCSNDLLSISMLNSPTEILEQGSIKGRFSMFALPLALKNLEENAFAKFSQAEGHPEQNCEVNNSLFMPSLTVPESLPQSLDLNYEEGNPIVYFPALVGERTYKDYVKDVFNLDVTTTEGGNMVRCFNVLTGHQVTFVHNEE